MSLADDLLELAKKSVNYSKSDLLDARLRRSISTGYYAVFHLLLESGSAKLAGHAGVRQLVSRAYSHGDMQQAAKGFQSQVLPAKLSAPFGAVPPVVPPEITNVAKVFVTLQEARHEADYNLSRRFTRAEAQQLVSRADQAFADWRAVTANPAHSEVRDLFLAALLLGQRWNK